MAVVLEQKDETPLALRVARLVRNDQRFQRLEIGAGGILVAHGYGS
jgi:hypothetical protein